MATTIEHPTIDGLTRVVPDDGVKAWTEQGWKSAGKADTTAAATTETAKPKR